MNRKQCALVTGATGFIGRALVRSLKRNGWEVHGTGRRTPENAPSAELDSYIELALPSEQLPALISKVTPTHLFHCAGKAAPAASLSDPAADFAATVPVTFQLLEALRVHAPDCHLIYTSSAAVYGDSTELPITENSAPTPISPYGYHKLAGELLCREYQKIYGIRTSIARIFSCYGVGLRRQIVWDACRKLLVEENPVFHGSGKETRDFVHVDDLVVALLLMANVPDPDGQPINIGAGIETEIGALISTIAETLKIPEQSWGFNGETSKGNPTRWVADISRLRALGYEARVPLSTGLQDIAQWARAELGESSPR